MRKLLVKYVPTIVKPTYLTYPTVGSKVTGEMVTAVDGKDYYLLVGISHSRHFVPGYPASWFTDIGAAPSIPKIDPGIVLQAKTYSNHEETVDETEENVDDVMDKLIQRYELRSGRESNGS